MPTPSKAAAQSIPGRRLGIDEGRNPLPGNGERWMADGACVGKDPETFFPNLITWRPSSPRAERAAKDAKRICNGAGVVGGCDVKYACLNYALADPELDGVWGGTTAAERHELRAKAEGSAA